MLHLHVFNTRFGLAISRRTSVKKNPPIENAVGTTGLVRLHFDTFYLSLHAYLMSGLLAVARITVFLR
jgi:hypothetical protein